MKQNIKDIEEVIIHCSATPPHMYVDAKRIDEWHKARGWDGIGYHKVILRDGKIENGRPLDKIGAHVRGHNTNTVGICLIGGIDDNGDPDNNFTNSQWGGLLECLGQIRKEIGHSFKISGHNEYNPHKACPSFEVKQWLRSL